MAFNPPLYTYVSPCKGYEDAPPLPDELNEDGKSFRNPPREDLSKAYEAFPAPLDNGRRGGLFVTSRLSRRKLGY
ncbi:DOPA 4,5-dioxygenase [Colletotrichum tofieldiae]|nr:DOPA 4,5-dioxygenase [Colletotrichum tofieldiae]GKT70954.1 DOPA 4,5-dioxygenase [Colletotrichum tofieldiae]GKT94140.1 dopa 4,5-dioxygenase [Colletotrichum tofieldiae]